MSDDTVMQESELDALKARADRLGVSYHPSIGTDKLREKIAVHLAGLPADPGATVAVDSENLKQQRLLEDQTKLVRVRLVCLNPNKKEWEGEVFTVGNALIGTISKYVPFNADNGWHIPQIMLKMLQERQCQTFVTEKVKNGVPVRRGKMIKEFAIEILPPLTDEELHDLAQQQAMANRID